MPKRRESVDLDKAFAIQEPVGIMPSNRDLGIFTGGHLFFEQLRKYSEVDVITYNVNDFIGIPNIRRLIIGRPWSSNDKNIKVEVSCRLGYKVYDSLHTKLYLGYGAMFDLEPYRVYVGSHNLANPRMFELMVRVSESQESYLTQYFNTLWNDPSVKIITK